MYMIVNGPRGWGWVLMDGEVDLAVGPNPMVLAEEVVKGIQGGLIDSSLIPVEQPAVYASLLPPGVHTLLEQVLHLLRLKQLNLTSLDELRAERINKAVRTLEHRVADLPPPPKVVKIDPRIAALMLSSK